MNPNDPRRFVSPMCELGDCDGCQDGAAMRCRCPHHLVSATAASASVGAAVGVDEVHTQRGRGMPAASTARAANAALVDPTSISGVGRGLTPTLRHI